MEPYPYSSSYPESGDSSPRSREIEWETAVSAGAGATWEDLPPPSSRVKLMCSYGGRIQPRSHDNQLSYVGGDSKILAVDRSVRYASIAAKLAALSVSDDVILKYQLPGEDLDTLISVTNDEDLEHMMIEYDRLHRVGSKPVPRLRLFLFTAVGKNSSQDRDQAAFADPLPAVCVPAAKENPDYLFGLEAPPPEAKVKDPAVVDPSAARSEVEALASPRELQLPVQELQRLQIAEKQQELQRLQIAEKQQEPQQVASIQQNGSDETLPRVYPPEYYIPPVQEKAPPAPQAAFWQGHQHSVAPAARFASFVGGDGHVYLIQTNPGVFPASTTAGQGYFTTVQRVVPAAAYDNGMAAMYPPPQQEKPSAGAYDSGVRAQAVEASAGYPAPAVGAYNKGAGLAAYDSAARAVCYTGANATFQSVNTNVAIAAESKALKPPQVS